MCGIAGWAGAVDARPGALEAMCDAIEHRGPDDHGAHVVAGQVALGFRRLSIIDLAGGHQPLYDERREVAVTCNGEIYNFQALREELSARGHRFATGSDAEVVAHLYEEDGPDCLRRLHGMFAIALWDERKRTLLLARDRLGVKPLYWARAPGGIAYASEPRALLASGLVEARPDHAALMAELTLQYVPAPRSGFEGIHKLAPGERLLFSDGGVRVERWWELPPPAPVDRSDDEALDELDALLRDATRARLVADVPLGAFLSGGIDSSLVVAYMAEASGEVRTFSIDFAEEGFSEAEHARAVARLYGTRHEDLLVEADVLPRIAEVACAFGEPYADSSAIPTFLLAELTRRHVTVALSGDGGDEAFAGYVRHRLAATAERADPVAPLLARAARRLGGRLVARRAPRVARGLDALSRTPQERYATIMSHFTPEQLDRVCTPEFVEAAGGTRLGWDALALPPGRGVDRYLRLDTLTYLPGDLLTKVDRASMAHALEVRSPLLDHRVHELAATLRPDQKLRRGETKWALKRLAERHGLPAELVTRPKQGFGVPIGVWFRGPLREWVTDLVTSDRGLIRPAEARRLLDEHLAGAADHAPRLWNLAMLELWFRQWIDR